jgi:2-polyprenyl-3-methyl-5-hydroxy-6-metoxy-1,4-benzoquinol methylase
MTTPSELGPDAVAALRDQLAVAASNGAAATEAGAPVRTAAVPTPSAATPVGVSARGRAVVRRVARPVVGRVLERIAVRVEARVLGQLASSIDAAETLAADHRRLEANLELLKGEVHALVAEVRALQVDPVTLAANVELLKAEVRAGVDRLDEFGWAVAPGAGPVGVPARMAELRERVEEVDRRVRVLATEASRPASSEPGAGEAGAPATTPVPVGGSGFDYTGFELRFRGDPADVRATLLDRYGELLSAHQPVLDVGCGRGELLAALAERGVSGVGVDLDAGMVALARAAGVEAHHADVNAYLRTVEPGSLGSIIAVHVVEHLELPVLVEFLELAASRLAPGGVLVAETPNPQSLIVLGNSYILDPTHVWPLHPSLLTFLCERAGFRDVRLRFDSPATDYQLPVPTVNDASAAGIAEVAVAIERLNQVLFGPQEYAVIATTRPAG